jgi:hypothetical protein
VDAGGVASESHVEGEHVDFAADGERLAVDDWRLSPSSLGTTGLGISKSWLNRF